MAGTPTARSKEALHSIDSIESSRRNQTVAAVVVTLSVVLVRTKPVVACESSCYCCGDYSQEHRSCVALRVLVVVVVVRC